MGEAKRRGNRESRMAAAMGLRELSIDDLRSELGLEQSAKYLGYAVHLEKSDEFLSEIVNAQGMQRKTWAKTPEMALLFTSLASAVETSRKCRGSIVVVVFDLGTQIMVYQLTGLHPVR